MEPESQSILRDLAIAQVHLRDYRGYHETRRKILASNARSLQSWTGLALAHHIAGNGELALAVLEQYERTLDPRRPADFESGEIVFFKVRVLEAMGRIESALHALAPDSPAGKRIVDRLGATATRARLFLALGRHAEAFDEFLALLVVNPESYVSHSGLQAAFFGWPVDALLSSGCVLRAARPGVLSPAQVDALAALYVALSARLPRCRAVTRILLDVLPAEHALFRPLLGAYLRVALRKGIPSLFSDLKTLYRGAGAPALGWAGRLASSGASAPPAGKAAVIAGVLGGLRAALEGGGGSIAPIDAIPDAATLAPALVAALRSVATGPSFSGKGSAATFFDAVTPAALEALAALPGDGAPENPSIVPWVALFAGRHADELGDTAGSLAAFDWGIGHTPTVIDLHVARGRALKHAGRISEAADATDHARSLDLADRHLNTKAVKYLLRAGRVDVAERTVGLFVKHDSKDPAADPLAHLKSMQVMWYELEAGAANERDGALGLALKHFARVDKHFADWVEDQYDYHSYCLRKMTLRTYVDLLATEDKVRGHTDYLRAALGAARCLFAAALDEAQRLGSKAFAGAVVRAPAAAVAAAAAPSEAATATPAGGEAAEAAASSAPATAEASVASDAAPPAAAPAAVAAPAEAAPPTPAGPPSHVGSSALVAQWRAARRLAVAARVDDAVLAAAAIAAKPVPAPSVDDENPVVRDTDPLGDSAIAGGAAASPLADAQRWLRTLSQNLPAEASDAASACNKAIEALNLVPGGQLATPLTGSCLSEPGVAAGNLRTTRNWRVDVPLALSAHGLGVAVALTGGRVGEAASRAAVMLRLATGSLKAPAEDAAALAPAAFVAVVRVMRAASAGRADGSVPAPVAAAVDAVALALSSSPPGCVFALATAAADFPAWVVTPACAAFSQASLAHASAVAALALEAAGYPVGLVDVPFHAAAPRSLAGSLSAAPAAAAAVAALRPLLAATKDSWTVPPSHSQRRDAFAIVCRAAEVGLVSDADLGDAADALLGVPLASAPEYL